MAHGVLVEMLTALQHKMDDKFRDDISKQIDDFVSRKSCF